MEFPRFSQSPRDPEFVQNPYAFYERAHAAGGVVWWEEYGWPALMRNADIQMALRDRRFGRRNPAPDPVPPHVAPFYDFEDRSMLELDGPPHARLRARVTRAFTARRVEGLAPEIDRLAHDLIDRIEPAGEADLLTAFCEPVPVLTIAALLGVPAEMKDQLLAWSHAMVAMYQFGRDRATEDAAVRATEDFSAFIGEEIAARRRAPRDDLLTALSDQSGDDPLTDAEAATTAILVLNAGHEATVHALGNGIKALVEAGARPDWFTEGAIEGTVEECLRHDPPLHIFIRYALEDVEAFGLTLKRGDRVGLILGAAGRDPAANEAPDRFDPTRFSPTHAAFGAGAHFCVGAPLARLEMRRALPLLFRRLPKLALAAAPRFADRYHFHGLERLDVKF